MRGMPLPRPLGGGSLQTAPERLRFLPCRSHFGQFAPARRTTDCERCHATADWKQTAFVHRPPFTNFLLDGKHEGVECSGCHLDVEVGGGVRARRYRGLPTTCAGCHVDVHRGAFRESTR